MDEQKIRNIAKDEIRQANSDLRFQQTGIPRHVHNGSDSPFIFNPTITYAGKIGSDGTPILLPKGWTSVQSATGVYLITHNLGVGSFSGSNNLLATNISYVVTASPASAPSVVTTINQTPNTVTFTWYDVLDGTTETDTTFFFLLTVINNKTTNPPSYFSNSTLS